MAIGPHAESEAEVLGKHDHPDVLAGKRLSVSIVTPRGSVLAHDLDELIAPGELGEFGLLPGHVPFLSALRPGVLTARDGTSRQIFAVGPGYLQVGAGGRVQVIVERAQAASEIDLDEARAERDRLAEEAKQPRDEAEGPGDLPERLEWARARVAAAEATQRTGT